MISGPGAGGRDRLGGARGRRLDPRGEAPPHDAEERLEILGDVESSFYLHLEVADRPRVLAAIADVLGRHEISVKSVVQRGPGPTPGS